MSGSRGGLSGSGRRLSASHGRLFPSRDRSRPSRDRLTASRCHFPGRRLRGVGGLRREPAEGPPRFGSGLPRSGESPPRCVEGPRAGARRPPRSGDGPPRGGSLSPRSGDGPQLGASLPQLGADRPQVGADSLVLGAERLPLRVDRPRVGVDRLPLGASPSPFRADRLPLGADVGRRRTRLPALSRASAHPSPELVCPSRAEPRLEKRLAESRPPLPGVRARGGRGDGGEGLRPADLRDQPASLLDFRRRPLSIGFEPSQCRLGVLRGIGSPAGIQEPERQVKAGHGGTV